MAAQNGQRHQRLSLRDLQIRAPIGLAGTQGEIGIPFGMRANEVVSHASLTLSLAWSSALPGDPGRLVVLLNGKAIGTVRPQPKNASGRTLTIPVDAALFLAGDNRLNFRLIGHCAHDCKDPFRNALRTEISNVRSWLDLAIQTLPLAPDLARLPAPFLDRHDNLPLQLSYVFAGSPNHGELEAAAGIASWFGGMTSVRSFVFKPAFGQVPSGNAIVFMTADRPIAALAALLPGPITGPGVAVIRNPGDPSGQLLVIVGRGPADLKLAAAAITNGHGRLVGQQISFDGVRNPVSPRNCAPRWLEKRASRVDIAFNSQDFRGEPHGAGKRQCADILPTSTIDLTRAYHPSRMPDLARFAGAGYPFTVRPDQGETVVLMDPQPSTAAVAAFLGLMGRFGDATSAAASAITVADRLDPDAMAGKDILVIGRIDLAAADPLFNKAPVHFRDGRLQLDEASRAERFFAYASPFGQGVRDEATHFLKDTAAFSGIVAFESPFQNGRSVIALLASDPEALPALVDRMADPRIDAQIEGDLSVASGDGMASFAVGPGYRVGPMPFPIAAGYWFADRPVLITLGGLLGAFALAVPVYQYLARRARRRLDKDDPE